MDNITDQLAKLAAKVGLNDEANTENPYRRPEDYIAAIAEYLDDGGSGGGSFAPDITDPQDGDTLVYNAAQQKWVNGAGAGGVLVVHDNDGTLDKTWKEIHDVYETGYVCVHKSTNDGEKHFPVACLAYNESAYWLDVYDFSIGIVTFGTDSENGYPVVGD